jgi:ketosteroid isomerase-like protein
MARGDGDLVRQSIDAFNRRDTPVFLDLISPDVQWVSLRAVLDGDVYHGHEGIRRFVADTEDDIDGMHVRVEEIFEVGEYVVVYGSIHGIGRGSHMELDLPIGWVVRVTSGVVDYLRAYPERRDALRAAEDARDGIEYEFGPPARALDS